MTLCHLNVTLANQVNGVAYVQRLMTIYSSVYETSWSKKVHVRKVGGKCKYSHVTLLYEPPHDKTDKMTCALSKDSDQPGIHPVSSESRCPHEETLGL